MSMHRACALLTVSILVAFSANAEQASAQARDAKPAGNIPATFADGLDWRLVGPQRGGWGTVAVGIADQPDTFYFGAAGGGVWKTINAGRTWEPIFNQGPASIGALAVAPSDPRVIYAGTGQVTTRYDVAAGEGVFKSSDSGATWHSVGLEATKHIGQIWVDPHNPDVVMVAALGHAFGANPERGVFRSEDGGKSWTRTLFVSENTGAVDIAVDPVDSNIVFASVWQMRFRPWMSYFTPDVGPESGVYKSVDAGRHWTRLAGKGWPEGNLGRIGLAATHTPQGTRVYAVVSAEAGGGLYRSDDAGANWKLVNDDGELNSSYFARLSAVPGNPDAVYAVGRSIHLCTDGGAKCEITKGSPGGDDYHDYWINPKHPDHMITASDQGTVVSVDAGASWSTWYNQPTGQLYHLATDNRFPYWIYAGQQDNGTVAIASRSDYGSIGAGDWHPVGAQERDDDIPDPRDPNIVYGSGLGGQLTRWDARNGEKQNISPWPVSSYGARPTSVKYHYTWITPIAVSRLPPYPLYQGAQVVFRSLDQGATWETISPDLSARDPKRTDCKGDQDAAGARACGYGVVFSFGLSPRDNDTIWVGMDDGGVQLARDAGKTWSNVTPKDLPAWARISSVDASALDVGTAYIAVDNHRQDDFRPMIWRTHDFGKTWTSITEGLPAHHFLGAVRADPVQRGLLYAGTETGVYVSLDDGDHWRSLQRNLPNAIVNDLSVHGNDLIAATQGRAIWVLDDVTPLRQMASASFAKEPAHLFAPATAIRVRGNQNNDTPLPREEPVGRNPPDGAIFDYWLARDAKSILLCVYDGSGKLLRRFASDDVPPKANADRYFEARWLKPQPNPSAHAGIHRFVWDLRLPRPAAAGYEYSIGAIDGVDTPLLPQGMLVAPGTYRVELSVDGRDYRQSLIVQADPRVPVDAAAVQSALALSGEVVFKLKSHFMASGEIQAVGKQLDEASKKLGSDPAKSAAAKAITDFQAGLAPLASGEGEDSLNLKDIGGALIALLADLETTDRAPSQPQREVYARYSERLQRALAAWEAIKKNDLPKLDAALHAAGIDAIKVPAVADLPVIDQGASREMP
jgi:photosystem II stability/assembly factor-like uncharacterized protein